jgi:CHAT domain-containing protein/tetratricopeptide (TPR) repeat protein
MEENAARRDDSAEHPVPDTASSETAPTAQEMPIRLDHVLALAAPITVPAPDALQPLIARINALTRINELPLKIELLNEALARVTAGEGDRVLWAALRTELGITLSGTSEGDPDENLEQAIACFGEAGRVCVESGFPAGHARAQATLGRAYWWRDIGPSRENIERAITCYASALHFFTLTDFPADYARTQNDLGVAYVYRIAGRRHENLERALVCFDAALHVWTPGEFPAGYAQVQSNLGLAYLYRLAGSRRVNLERAIACCAEALNVFSPMSFPFEYADTRNKLGMVYIKRVEGDRRANLEKAIGCCFEALRIFTPTTFAFHYARTQNNLGQAYRRRLAGYRGTNIEQAIACYDKALRVWTAESIPSNHAMVQDSLGEAYLDRIAGERSENVEQAIECLDVALSIWTLEDFPVRHAAAQARLGRAYQARVVGNRRDNLERAAESYEEALRVFTLAEAPLEYRNVQLDRAWLAYDALVAAAGAEAEPAALQAAYRQAHEAFLAAREAQAELGWLEADEQGHAIMQRMRPDLRTMYARDAWCLAQVGDLRGAAVALEAGRAQALAESQAIAAVSLDAVCAEHAVAFDEARQQWHEARAQNDRTASRTARDTFLAARGAIRAHCRPDFLPSAPGYQDIAAATAPDQALIYLAAADCAPRAIALPQLTEQAVDRWMVRRDAAGRVLGGYQYAVRHAGADLLREWLFAACAEERVRLLDLALRDVAPSVPDAMPTLRAALDEVVAAWRAEADLLSGGSAPQQQKARELRQRLAQPLAQALGNPHFANDLSWFLREAELERLLDELSATFVSELRRTLDALGLGDPEQPLALVPCGRLGVLPIHAAWARHDLRTGERIPLQETCQLTLQPSARALAHARRAADLLPRGGPLLAVGDPQPTAAPTLEWAEAEAEAIAILARRAGRRESEAVIGAEATLHRVLSALEALGAARSGAWVHAACHGHADPSDPANCYLLLGYDERLAVDRLLRQRLLDGVRGVSASGCVTGLGDFEMAPDELSSFAAGVLQAGAPCAVAMLWSVSDRATFLLMLRFAQQLFGQAGTSPARALREAARWLRTADQARIEECARGGPHGTRPGMAPAQPEREEEAAGALRGVATDIPSMPTAAPDQEEPRVEPCEEPQPEGVRMAAAGAFALLAVPRASHRRLDRPYDHPIYWAAAVIYGA